MKEAEKTITDAPAIFPPANKKEQTRYFHLDPEERKKLMSIYYDNLHNYRSSRMLLEKSVKINPLNFRARKLLRDVSSKLDDYNFRKTLK